VQTVDVTAYAESHEVAVTGVFRMCMYLKSPLTPTADSRAMPQPAP
jgi:hypothetical protein